MSGEGEIGNVESQFLWGGNLILCFLCQIGKCRPLQTSTVDLEQSVAHLRLTGVFKITPYEISSAARLQSFLDSVPLWGGPLPHPEGHYSSVLSTQAAWSVGLSRLQAGR